MQRFLAWLLTLFCSVTHFVTGTSTYKEFSPEVASVTGVPTLGQDGGCMAPLSMLAPAARIMGGGFCEVSDVPR